MIWHWLVIIVIALVVGAVVALATAELLRLLGVSS